MDLIRLLILILGLAAGLMGKTDPELDRLFQEGNAAYQAENYPEAIRLYEEVTARGYDSGLLYFNLGNAYYRTSQIGPAILNYERAARRMPTDPNVAFNLKLANLSVKDRIEVPPAFFLFRWYQNCVNLLTARIWAVLFAVLMLLAVIGFAIWLNLDRPRLRRFCKIWFIISGLLSLLVALMLIPKFHLETADDQGIIINTAVSSLAAPQVGSTELFIVHEGTKVKILDYDDNWYKIELIDGKQGWVPGAEVAKI